LHGQCCSPICGAGRAAARRLGVQRGVLQWQRVRRCRHRATAAPLHALSKLSQHSLEPHIDLLPRLVAAGLVVAVERKRARLHCVHTRCRGGGCLAAAARVAVLRSRVVTAAPPDQDGHDGCGWLFPTSHPPCSHQTTVPSCGYGQTERSLHTSSSCSRRKGPQRDEKWGAKGSMVAKCRCDACLLSIWHCELACRCHQLCVPRGWHPDGPCRCAVKNTCTLGMIPAETTLSLCHTHLQPQQQLHCAHTACDTRTHVHNVRLIRHTPTANTEY
jgi:hypothetical protein